MRVAPMTSRFLDACRRRPTDVRPVWFMRQAGRYMKQYRDIRAHHGILEICKRPDLAAQVTLHSRQSAPSSRRLLHRANQPLSPCKLMRWGVLALYWTQCRCHAECEPRAAGKEFLSQPLARPRAKRC